MRLTILGGGGFRVPLVHAALAADGAVDTVVLHDTDPTRVRSVKAVIDDSGASGPRVLVEDDLARAVSGADFVFSAIRVGGLQGRAIDERTALSEGVLGQETVGAGGVCYGLRTVPVATTIAETVRDHAPDAWVINFTNPAGMVTEAMRRVLGDRVIGICDSPVGLFRRVARALDVSMDAAWFDYAGLNHLGWLRRVLVDGHDRLPELLADDRRLATFEEGRLFGPDWLRSLKAIPNEYLYYYYFTADAIAAIRAAGATRGEYLLQQQRNFYRASETAHPAALWEQTRKERETTYMAESREASGAGDRAVEDLDGGGYDRLAIALMRAIANDERTTLVLNVGNRSAIRSLDADAVVEVPCLVGRNGAQPIATGDLDPAAAALAATVKSCERATIDAALAGSRSQAVSALALHPLVDSVGTAERIIGNHGLLDRFS